MPLEISSEAKKYTKSAYFPTLDSAYFVIKLYPKSFKDRTEFI